MDKANLSRREFAGLAAAAAVPFLTAPAEAAPLQPPAGANDVQALTDWMRARYGKHLDEDQLKAVRGRIERIANAAERLRKFPVGQDDPAFVFQADL